MKRKILLTAGILIIAGAVVGFSWRFSHRTTSLLLPGTVEIQEVRLSSKIGGRVDKVAVKEGDLVKAGQPVVFFEVPELKAQCDQAQARLQAAEADLDKARNGPRIEEKDAAQAAVAAAEARLQRLQAGFRVEEVEQAKNELATAEADLDWAKRDLTRLSRLYTENAISRSDYDAAVAANGRAQGRASAATAHLKMYQAGSRREEVDEAKAELKRLQANYDLLRVGTRSEDLAMADARVSELKAKLHELEVSLEEAVIKAPEAAVVEVVGVRKGDVVAPNQPVVRVLRADDLWVKVYVPELQLGQVRLNQEVNVTIDSYPGRIFRGSIEQIASSSEFTPRNVQSVDERRYQVFALKVRVPDPEGIFKSGMAAEVEVPLKD